MQNRLTAVFLFDIMIQQMLKNTTKVDKKLIFQLSLKVLNFKRLVILSAVAAPFLFFVSLYAFLIQDYIAAAFFFGSIVFIIFMNIFIYLAVKKQANSHKFCDNVIYQYDINDEGLEILLSSDTTSSNTTFNWDGIHSARKIGEYILVFISKSQFYTINRNEFTQGTEAEFSDLLAEKLGKKYKGHK